MVVSFVLTAILNNPYIKFTETLTSSELKKVSL